MVQHGLRFWGNLLGLRKWILPESYLAQIYTGGEGIKNLTKKRLLKTKQNYKDMSIYLGLKAKVNKLTGIIAAVKADTERRDKLEQARQEYYSVAMQANDARIKMLKCRDIVDGLEPIGKAVEIKAQRMVKMENVVTDYNRCVLGIEQAEISMDRTSGIDIAWRFIMMLMSERKKGISLEKNRIMR